MRPLSLPRPRELTLPLLALVTLALGSALFHLDQRVPETVWEGRDLIAGLDPKELSKLSFKTGTTAFTLARQGSGFGLDTQGDAPVDLNKLNEVILRLGGAQVAEVIGGKRDWDELHVSDKSADLTVELYGRESTPRWKVYLGKSVPGKPGRAVRLEGTDQVFATKDYLYLSTTDTEYLAREAFRIAKSTVKGLQLTHGATTLDEKKFVRDSLLSALDPLRVRAHHRTGALSASLQQLSWEWQAQVSSEDGVAYTLSFAKHDGKWYAKAIASLNQSIDENAPVLDVKLLALKAEADRFNQQKAGWVWELASESATELEKGLMLSSTAKADPGPKQK